MKYVARLTGAFHINRDGIMRLILVMVVMTTSDAGIDLQIDLADVEAEANFWSIRSGPYGAFDNVFNDVLYILHWSFLWSHYSDLNQRFLVRICLIVTAFL